MQQPVALQSIEVDASHARHLVGHVGFLVDDGSQGADLYGGETLGLGLLLAFLSPELVVFLEHADDKTFGIGVPVKLVGVGQEEGRDGVFVESQLFDIVLLVQ